MSKPLIVVISGLKEANKLIEDQLAKKFKCDCRYIDGHGNCTDCLNKRIMIECDLSWALWVQFNKNVDAIDYLEKLK